MHITSVHFSYCHPTSDKCQELNHTSQGRKTCRLAGQRPAAADTVNFSYPHNVVHFNQAIRALYVHLAVRLQDKHCKPRLSSGLHRCRRRFKVGRPSRQRLQLHRWGRLRCHCLIPHDAQIDSACHEVQERHSQNTEHQDCTHNKLFCKSVRSRSCTVHCKYKSWTRRMSCPLCGCSTFHRMKSKHV